MLVLIAGGAVFFLPNFLKAQIETRGSQALEGTLTIGNLRLLWGYPFQIQIDQLDLATKKNNERISIQKIVLQASLKEGLKSFNSPHPVLAVKTQKAKIHLLLRPKPTPSESAPPTSMKNSLPDSFRVALAPLKLKDLSFDIDFNETQILIERLLEDLSSEKYTLQASKIKVSSVGLDQPISVLLQGNLSTPYPQLVQLPIDFQTQVFWSQKWIQLPKIHLSFMGLQSEGSGRTTVDLETHLWKTAIQIKELSKIPMDLMKLPFKIEQGSLIFALEVAKNGASTPWEAKGNISLLGVKGNIQVESEKFQLRGPLALDISSLFSAQGSAFSFSNLKLSADATSAEIQVPKVFKKSSNIPLVTKIDGQGNLEGAQLESVSLQLGAAQVFAKGTFSRKGRSNFNLKIPPLSLNGFESFFPPLASYPATGTLSLESRIVGNIMEPKSLEIDILDLQAQRIQTQLQWNKEDQSLSLQGPASLDLKAKGKILNFIPVGLIAQGKLDTSGMGVSYKDLFKKSRGQRMTLEFNTSQIPNGIQLNKAYLQTNFGSFQAQGTLPMDLSQAVDLRSSFSDFNFVRASESIPLLKKYLSAGSLDGGIQLKGKINTQQFLDSPLTTDVRLNLKVPEFSYSSGSPKAEETVKDKKVPYDPKPFFEKKSFYDGLQVNLRAEIQNVKYNDLRLQGLQTQVNLTRGMNLQTTLSIKDIFGGSFSLKDLKIPLYAKEPSLTGNSIVRNLDMGRTLSWGLPSLKELVQGQANGNFNFKSSLPQNPKFLDNLFVKGKVEIPQGRMETLRFVSMAKSALSKIPQVGEKVPEDVGPLDAKITADFELMNQVLKLTSFEALTTQQDLVKVKGSIKLTKDVDLNGEIALASAPVKGSFKEANSDPQGRLLIPVLVQGNLTNPQLSFVTSSLQAMIQKMIQYEGNKLKARAQEEAQKFAEQKKQEAQAEIEKQKSKIEESAKSEINKLLGR